MKIFGYQPGLQSKIMGALILVGLLPLSILAFQLISLNRQAFSEQVLRVHALSSQATASQVEAYLQSLITVANTGAYNPTLYLSPSSSEAQQLQADLLGSSAEEVFAIVSVTEAQQEILRVQKKGRSDLVDKLLPLAQPGQVTLLNFQDLPWLVISAKFPEGGGDLRLFASARKLNEMMDPSELGDGAILVLIDENGQPLLESQSGAQLPPEMTEVSTSVRVSGSGKFQMADGSTVLGSYAPLAAVPWHVVTWQPLAVAEGIAMEMRKQAGQAFGLALLITAFLSLVAYWGMVRPIRALLKANPSWSTGSGDEIKQLERAFALLSKKDEDESEEIEEIFLGRYQVLKKVGQGGMGAVFHGFDPKLERPIALKTLLLNRSRSQEKTKDQIVKLLREATTVANINHANIVSVYDVKDTDQYAYVAMEYVDGSSLSDYLEHHGPLDPQKALPLFVEVAKGLAAAHEKAIVHRDIKPANILLGKDHSVKIADFGISQLMTSLEGEKEKVAGTPGFLSPEVLKNKPFTEAADLFALGVTMYRVLTGRYPFTGATVKSILLKTLYNEPRAPHLINDQIPEPLSDIVMRLLHKNPEERLTNSKVLINALEAMLDGSRWIYSELPTPIEADGDKTIAPEELQYVATSTNLYSNPGN